MKQFKILFFLILFNSCSAIDFSRVAPGYVEAFESLDVLIRGHEDTFITAELISKIPYASLVMNIGKGPKGLLILESINGSESTWVSADNVYLVKRDGKIIRTTGLINNLNEILYSVDFSNVLDIDTEQTYIYYASFTNPDLYNLKLKASFTKRERKLMKLLNSKIYLTLVEEEVVSEDLGWKVTNKYWVDDNSFIWKSVQSISPKLPNLFIEITKKPS